ETSNGSGVHHRARLLREHDGQHAPQAEEYALDVSGQHLVEHRFVISDDRGDLAFDTGIVEEAIDAAVGVHRRLYVTLHLGRLGDVGDMEARITALLADGGRRTLCPFRIAVDDDDLGATTGERKRGSPADAIAAPGDQSDFSV